MTRPEDLRDPALLDRPVTFEPVAMEVPSWTLIGAAAAGAGAVIFATWSGVLFG